MDFPRRRRMDPAIDMTPMIDCVFQLLVFFLLASSFRSPSLSLKLPLGEASEKPPLAPITVELDANGDVRLDSEPASLDSLPGDVRNAAAALDEPRVLLRAHAKLEYEDVLQVLMAIRKGGVDQVQLAYEAEDRP